MHDITSLSLQTFLGIPLKTGVTTRAWTKAGTKAASSISLEACLAVLVGTNTFSCHATSATESAALFALAASLTVSGLPRKLIPFIESMTVCESASSTSTNPNPRDLPVSRIGHDTR
jgi:hypothetical protein